MVPLLSLLCTDWAMAKMHRVNTLKVFNRAFAAKIIKGFSLKGSNLSPQNISCSVSLSVSDSLSYGNIMYYYPYRAFGDQNKIVYSTRFVRRAIFFKYCPGNIFLILPGLYVTNHLT